MHLLQNIQRVSFFYRLVFVAIYEANVQIDTSSLHRIRTGLHDVEDLDGYIENNNAECVRKSTYIQCLLYKVKKSRHFGITAANTCSDIFYRTVVICILSEAV